MDGYGQNLCRQIWRMKRGSAIRELQSRLHKIGGPSASESPFFMRTQHLDAGLLKGSPA